MFRRPTILVSLLVLVLAAAFAATSRAGNGYVVWGTAQHRPTSGSVYTVLTHGRTPQKALLTVYLDSKPCLAAQKNEAKRFTSSAAGESHFRNNGKAFTTMWVNGHWNTALFAIAGTKAEPEYACSYLTSRNSQGEYKITVARRSNQYFVTN